MSKSPKKSEAGSKKSPPPRRTAPERKLPLGRLALVVGGALVVLALLWAGIFAVLQGKEKPAPTSSSTGTVEQVPRTVSGKTVEEDQREATARVTAMLQAAKLSPTGADPAARLQALENGDLSVVDPSLRSFVHIASTSDSALEAKTYQALLTIAVVLSGDNQEKELAPVSPDSWKNAFADPQLGTVFVPLHGWAAQGALFSFEMVYLEGEWKLAPYSLLDAINISATVQESLSQSTPAPTPGR